MEEQIHEEVNSFNSTSQTNRIIHDFFNTNDLLLNQFNKFDVALDTTSENSLKTSQIINQCIGYSTQLKMLYSPTANYINRLIASNSNYDAEIAKLNDVCNERLVVINKLSKETRLLKDKISILRSQKNNSFELRKLKKLIEAQNFLLEKRDLTMSSKTKLITLEKIIKKQLPIIKKLTEKNYFILNLLKRYKLYVIYSFFKQIYLDNKNRIKAFISPKLGRLNIHPPKKIRIPSRYYTRPILNNPPLISIVTPSFNQGVFLERTIKSIINQSYPNLEYIVQDGNSTDNTQEVLEKYAAFLKHYAITSDNGQSHAINLGFQHATGDIMAYLNSDDLLLPGSLHYVADFFANNPDIDVVYGHRIIIDEKDNEIGRWVLPPHDSNVLLWADFVPQETLFWRRRIWDKVGASIDESFRFAMDWDLILRFKYAQAKFARLPRFLGAFRVHIQQKTSRTLSRLGLEEMRRIRYNYHHRKISHSEIMKMIKPYLNKHFIYHKLYALGILRY